MKNRLSGFFGKAGLPVLAVGVALALMPVSAMAAARGGEHFGGGASRGFAGGGHEVRGGQARGFGGGHEFSRGYQGGYYRGGGYVRGGVYLGAPYGYAAPNACGFYDAAGYWHPDPAACYGPPAVY
jgi:hypothetical protein